MNNISRQNISLQIVVYQMLVHSTSPWHQFLLVILAEENSGNIPYSYWYLR